jgi:hypothetical protein
VTRYDFFRRRIAPVAFVLALGLMAFDTCHKHQRTHGAFVLQYGVFATDVREVEAEVWMNGERVSDFHRRALEGGYIGATKFDVSLPDTSGEIRFDVDLANGDRRHIVRQVHLSDGETVTFDLEPDLR